MAVTSTAERDRTVVLVHPSASASRSIQPWCDLPGVKRLALGVESGSPRIRTLLHKPNDEEALHEINVRFRTSAIMPMYFFMLGFCSFVASDRGCVTPFKRTHPAATAASRIDAWVARFRMRHMLYRAPIELAAATALGLYDHAV